VVRKCSQAGARRSLRIRLNTTTARDWLPLLRGLPSQVKGAGFRVQSRRCSWVRIPSPAPNYSKLRILISFSLCILHPRQGSPRAGQRRSTDYHELCELCGWVRSSLSRPLLIVNVDLALACRLDRQKYCSSALDRRRPACARVQAQEAGRA
jgi:hypothetical protein